MATTIQPRENYYTKYRDVYERWKLPKTECYDIINKYATLLIRELLKNEKEGIKLPSYYKDLRTPHDYIYDIIDGWLIEDLVLLWLTTHGVAAAKYGDDKNNVIIRHNSKKITNKQDIIINNIKPLELQLSRNIRSIYHIKINKAKRLMEDDGILMYVIYPTDSYFLISSKDFANLQPKANPCWGGKVAYEIKSPTYYRFADDINPLVQLL